MQFWTDEEFKKFIAVVDNFLYKVIFSFLYLTGARRGEALALYWDDIDFKNGTVKIHKNCDFHKKGVTFEILDTPKNNSSNRIIYISNNLLNMLKELKQQTTGKFVFNGERPTPPENIRRYLRNAASKAGVKLIRIHDLRHSHASLLINNGCDILTVAQRLGHKNIEQTLNTYAHLFPNKQKEVLKMLDFDI